MRLDRLRVRNFRTLEDFDISFPQYYTAICGRNDSGKSNVLRAIRAIVMDDQSEESYEFDEDDVLASRDYPKWKKLEKTSPPLEITAHFRISKDADAAIHSFLIKYLELNTQTSDEISLVVTRTSTETAPKTVLVSVDENNVAELAAQEVHKRLLSSRSILFHNSAGANTAWAPGHLFGAVMASSRDDLEALRQTIEKKLKKVALQHQKELTELLGRLEESYRVTVDLPSMDFRYLRYGLALSDKKIEVPLTNWGSGTRNRTMILLNLFRARQISESETSASKITPMIIVEEPESFLHPSAQSEFARVLQSLAAELKIQVIATTHSPYMLSHANPQANVLLERHHHYSQQRETRQKPIADDNWMEPFSLALGITGEELAPWRELFFTKADRILLVEGPTDVEYLELLKHTDHGQNALRFDGEIYPYEGWPNLKNGVLLRFLKNQYKRFFVTFDLDAEQEVEPMLKGLGFVRGEHYAAVGINKPGKRAMEGLVPESVLATVYGSQPALVQQAQAGTSAEKRAACLQLKKLILNRFRQEAKPTKDYYQQFYELAKVVNKAMK